jgi:hypothetical protein
MPVYPGAPWMTRHSSTTFSNLAFGAQPAIYKKWHWALDYRVANLAARTQKGRHR